MTEAEGNGIEVRFVDPDDVRVVPRIRVGRGPSEPGG